LQAVISSAGRYLKNLKSDWPILAHAKGFF